MKPMDIARHLEQSKSDASLVERIEAAVEGSTYEDALTAVTSVQASVILKVTLGDERLAYALTTETMRMCIDMVKSKVVNSKESMN